MRYRLRARIKVQKRGDDGPAFRFGVMYSNLDYSGGISAGITVGANDVAPDEWRWYELREPVRWEDRPRGQSAFVQAMNNPDNVDAVLVDLFELVPCGQ